MNKVMKKVFVLALLAKIAVLSGTPCLAASSEPVVIPATLEVMEVIFLDLKEDSDYGTRPFLHAYFQEPGFPSADMPINITDYYGSSLPAPVPIQTPIAHWYIEYPASPTSIPEPRNYTTGAGIYDWIYCKISAGSVSNWEIYIEALGPLESPEHQIPFAEWNASTTPNIIPCFGFRIMPNSPTPGSSHRYADPDWTYVSVPATYPFDPFGWPAGYLGSDGVTPRPPILMESYSHLGQIWFRFRLVVKLPFLVLAEPGVYTSVVRMTLVTY